MPHTAQLKEPNVTVFDINAVQTVATLEDGRSIPVPADATTEDKVIQGPDGLPVFIRAAELVAKYNLIG
jgi:hypothetical protein